MNEPKKVILDKDAIQAFRLILGIMMDQIYIGETPPNWDFEHVIMLEQRLEYHDPEHPFDLAIEDAALLLHGMAFTEVASADLPWVDMVRWTSDFVTSELRQYWTEEEWQNL